MATEKGVVGWGGARGDWGGVGLSIVCRFGCDLGGFSLTKMLGLGLCRGGEEYMGVGWVVFFTKKPR